MSKYMSGTRRHAAFAAVILAMFAFAVPIAARAQDGDSTNSMTVGGVLAYFGMLPAAIVREHSQSHPEGSMHGGAPDGKHEYHLVLALFDAASGKRIESAQVSVTIMGLGYVGRRQLDLDAMTIANTVTWGAFVNLPGNDLYDLTFDVILPGHKAAIAFPFRYSHSNN